jgi:hypothetical protein
METTRDRPYGARMVTTGDRFWSKVDYSNVASTGCIEWAHNRDRHGYGRFHLDGRSVLAHRWAYEQANGAIPEGALVLHKCHNRLCVNPAHLRIGTCGENSADMVLAGRSFSNKGELNGRSKLTEADVRAIREMGGSGARKIDIAKRFGISASNVYLILSGKGWPHV